MAIKPLPLGLDYIETGGVYFKNSVYIYGGKISNQNALDAAHKYDLIKNTWIRLSSLPCPGYDCSCVSFKNKILVSGYGHSRLYLYDISLDSYSELLNLWPYNKVTAVGNNRAYLFEFPGNIYESDSEDEYSWKRIGANRIAGKNCYRVLYQNYFYFEMRTSQPNNNLFCKFNLEQKELTLYAN